MSDVLVAFWKEPCILFLFSMHLMDSSYLAIQSLAFGFPCNLMYSFVLINHKVGWH
jgi:hypothetical protein